MSLKLQKWHALGNDFLISKTLVEARQIIQLSSRNFGIGCDQFVILEGLKVRFFNADGSESGMCGNALKCIAEVVSRETNATTFQLQMKKGLIDVKFNEGRPSICIGKPLNFKPAPNPFSKLKKNFFAKNCNQFFYLDLGNPHIVCILHSNPTNFLSDKEITEEVREAGKFLQTLFPETAGINASFSLIKNSREMEVRTFERGVGETLSCGSGACASFYSALKSGMVSNNAKVFNAGSKKVLDICKNHHLTSLDNNENVWLEGFGVKVAEIIC